MSYCIWCCCNLFHLIIDINPNNELIGAQDRMVSEGRADTWQPSAAECVWRKVFFVLRNVCSRKQSMCSQLFIWCFMWDGKVCFLVITAYIMCRSTVDELWCNTFNLNQSLQLTPHLLCMLAWRSWFLVNRSDSGLLLSCEKLIMR